jgi:hypothetical protein
MAGMSTLFTPYCYPQEPGYKYFPAQEAETIQPKYELQGLKGDKYELQGQERFGHGETFRAAELSPQLHFTSETPRRRQD